MKTYFSEYLKPLLFESYAGIKTLGLYRIGGVNSKVQKLMTTVFCKLHYIISTMLKLVLPPTGWPICLDVLLNHSSFVFLKVFLVQTFKKK